VSDLRRLFNDIVRFEIELWNSIDTRLKREFDLPLTHFEPMAVIDTLPGCRVYDIARELGITTGGTSKLVDRIEANGYCRRLPNPADRRSSLLELTPEGQRLFAEAGVAFDAHPPSRCWPPHRDGGDRLAGRASFFALERERALLGLIAYLAAARQSADRFRLRLFCGLTSGGWRGPWHRGRAAPWP
jgi:MarR family transcriptional regulator, organic hydroperoxide resistance regulator